MQYFFTSNTKLYICLIHYNKHNKYRMGVFENFNSNLVTFNYFLA